MPMSNVWSHEKTHTRCIDELSGNLRGSFTMHRRIFGDASGNIRGFIGATSANSYDVLLESAMVGDPSAIRRGVMMMS